jgi:hypothetical protein
MGELYPITLMEFAMVFRTLLALMIAIAAFAFTFNRADATRLHSTNGWVGPGGISSRTGLRDSWGFSGGGGVWISCNPGAIMCWSIGGEGFDNHWLLIWPRVVPSNPDPTTDNVNLGTGGEIDQVVND